MYQQVSSALSVTHGTESYSRAVSLAGANQVLFEATAIAIVGSSTALRITLQSGNDLENWTDDLDAEIDIAVVGYTATQTASGISAAYVRLRYTVLGTGGDGFIVAAGIHTAEL